MAIYGAHGFSDEPKGMKRTSDETSKFFNPPSPGNGVKRKLEIYSMKTLRTLASASALVLALSATASAGTFVNDAGIEEQIVPNGAATQVVGSVETRLSDNPAHGQYDSDLRQYVSVVTVDAVANFSPTAGDQQPDIRSDAAAGYHLDESGYFLKN